VSYKREGGKEERREGGRKGGVYVPSANVVPLPIFVSRTSIARCRERDGGREGGGVKRVDK